MSATINGEFHLGETWVFQGIVRDHRSVPIDITGAVVRLRISTAKSITVLDLETPTTGAVIDAEAGTYEFTVSPAQQSAAGVTPGAYKYEVKVTLSGGLTTVQNTGTLTISPSLFRL